MMYYVYYYMFTFHSGDVLLNFLKPFTMYIGTMMDI